VVSGRPDNVNDDTQTGTEALEAAEMAEDTNLGDGGKTKDWTDPGEPE
jgi:hypothetical protein